MSQTHILHVEKRNRNGRIESSRTMRVTRDQATEGMKNVLDILSWDRPARSVHITYGDGTSTKWILMQDPAQATAPPDRDALWCRSNCQYVGGKKMHRSDCPFQPARRRTNEGEPNE